MGILVSAMASILVTGAGLAEHTTWRQAVAVFCASMLTHATAYLKVPGTGSTDTVTPPKP